jgi:hypothetical protein
MGKKEVQTDAPATDTPATPDKVDVIVLAKFFDKDSRTNPYEVGSTLSLSPERAEELIALQLVKPVEQAEE